MARKFLPAAVFVYPCEPGSKRPYKAEHHCSRCRTRHGASYIYRCIGRYANRYTAEKCAQRYSERIGVQYGGFVPLGRAPLLKGE
jgi:hypothetical protein